MQGAIQQQKDQAASILADAKQKAADNEKAQADRIKQLEADRDKRNQQLAAAQAENRSLATRVVTSLSLRDSLAGSRCADASGKDDTAALLERASAGERFTAEIVGFATTVAATADSAANYANDCRTWALGIAQ